MTEIILRARESFAPQNLRKMGGNDGEDDDDKMHRVANKLKFDGRLALPAS